MALGLIPKGNARLMAKKKNSRKVLAVALGIMGIAGLSLASASQLNITASDNLATGTQVFGSPCDDVVNVAYTTGGTATAPTYTDVKISGIASACVTVPAKAISYVLTYQTWNGASYDAAATVTASDVPITAANSGTNSLTVALPALAQAGTTKFVNVAITIK